MKLIVDSGSTKTDWCFAQSSSTYTLIQTDGINPIVQPSNEIISIVRDQMYSSVVQQQVDLESLNSIYFYGAGCTIEHCAIIEQVLHSVLCKTIPIYIDSDLLAAARALCGTQAGIACILGTGSNSCYYDGVAIEQHTPALGYILGDEGSGAVLGRMFINALLKGVLPQAMRNDFFDEFSTNQADIIDKVYHNPSPNRFLASISKFILPRVSDIKLEKLVTQNFENFIVYNITNYSKAERVINAVGSVAFLYNKQLKQAAENHGYKIGKLIKSPLEGLLEYHFSNK